MSAQQQPPTSVPRRRGSFLGRLAAALLMILISTALSLGAVAAGFFSLGFTPDTPRRLAETQAENVALQTRVADLERRASDSRESLDQLRTSLAEISGIAGRLAESDMRSATVAAEARASRDAVALFATAEAERAGLLTTLRQRSERVERFVQRLGDIAQDAALDLSGAPAAGAAATATPSPAAATAAPSPAAPVAPTPTALSGATASPSQSATPTAAASPTGTPTPSASPTGTAGPSASPTRTPAGAPASTPTLGR
jgi:hypothetical protein